MSGCHNPYEGQPKPIRTLADDIVKESNNLMILEMKEMEARIKRHVTECKHEVIKEMMSVFDIKKPTIKKEVMNVK